MTATGRRAKRQAVKAYRIVKRKFVPSAFSGEGARLYGGRWNSPGVAVVYTSSTIALAVLEWRAHFTQWPAPAVMIIEIEFDPSLIWEPPKLPANWGQLPAPKGNTVIGDSWIAAGRSAVLKIPSAIVPNEFNYLLNPSHPQFGLIRRGRPQLFKVDARLGPLAMSKP